jgi:hypothetical protein
LSVEGVVELRLVHQLVHAPHVFEEEGADLGYGGLEPVEVYLLARPLVPVVGAKADDVALVGHHVDDLVLLEEAPDGRVLLSVLLARLDGDGERRAAVELPAQDGMGDHRGAPVDHEEVEPAELREIIGPILVAHGVVGLRAIVRVAEIVDDQLVACTSAEGRRTTSGCQSRSLLGRSVLHQNRMMASAITHTPRARGKGATR